MLACIPTASLFGVDADPVTIEVQVHAGLPCTTVVGGPDATCREAKERVRAAFASCGFEWPNKRVTINLSPAWQKKRGSAIDLAMAVGILLASEQLPPGSTAGCAFLGELGLDGAVRPVVGVVPLAEAAGGDPLVVPAPQVTDAELACDRVVGVAHLAELVRALRGEAPWPLPLTRPTARRRPVWPDLSDVRGQDVARTALEVAAAGGHHLLLTGPPGGGKTMLAERLPGLLPPLSAAEALEVTKIHSAAGVLPAGAGLIDEPPYEAPHTTASAVALIGGGSSQLRPGSISLAHRGVLFLDELGEQRPVILECLRQPLEEGVIRIHRAVGSATLPARFLLVAAMNPCPCGEGAGGRCRCQPAERLRYSRRLSGPLLDRFDLRLHVPRAEPDQLLGEVGGEPTASVAARVAAARRRGSTRGMAVNALVPGSRLDEVAPLDRAARRLLAGLLSRGGLSARGLHRVRRVA
ncbi:MAG: YifB family Mg chelatase-like AAA ATPase, partial [Acidimicrobiales bacterium]